MSNLKIELTEAPEADDIEAVRAGLSDFNDATMGPTNRRPLALFVRREGKVLGGLFGYTGWGWLYVQWLWIDDALRGQGLARDLLLRAETEAVARQCHGAYIDTFNPVALKLYAALGYQSFGVIEDFPPGHARTFLHKRLGP